MYVYTTTGELSLNLCGGNTQKPNQTKQNKAEKRRKFYKWNESHNTEFNPFGVNGIWYNHRRNKKSLCIFEREYFLIGLP